MSVCSSWRKILLCLSVCQKLLISWALLPGRSILPPDEEVKFEERGNRYGTTHWSKVLHIDWVKSHNGGPKPKFPRDGCISQITKEKPITEIQMLHSCYVSAYFGKRRLCQATSFFFFFFGLQTSIKDADINLWEDKEKSI